MQCGHFISSSRSFLPVHFRRDFQARRVEPDEARGVVLVVGCCRVGFHRGGQKTRSATAGKANRRGAVAFSLSTLRSTATEDGWTNLSSRRLDETSTPGL